MKKQTGNFQWTICTLGGHAKGKATTVREAVKIIQQTYKTL